MKYKALLVMVLMLIGQGLMAQDTLTVAVGSSTSGGFPVNFTYPGSDQRNQMLYPASMLEEIPVGSSITKLIFYTTINTTYNFPGSWEVRMTEVSDTAFANNTQLTVGAGASVFSGAISINDENVGILLDQAYEYHGGSLLIEFRHNRVTGASVGYGNFYGVRTRPNISISWSGQFNYYDDYTPYLSNFMPKLSLIYLATTCPTPTGITLDALEATEAHFHFGRGSASDTLWTVRYWSESDDAQDIMIGDTAFVLSQLTENTVYNMMVRTVCEEGDTSVGAYFSFRTPCGDLPIPFFTDFESYPTHYANQPLVSECWHRINNYSGSGTGTYSAPYPIVDGEQYWAHSGNNTLKFIQARANMGLTEQIAVLPPVDATESPIGELSVRFWGQSYSGAAAQHNGTLQVGVMTVPDNPNTFTSVGEVTIGENYEEHAVSLASYQGNGTYIAFRCPTISGSWSTNIYVDDLSVESSVVEVNAVALDSATRDTLREIVIIGCGMHQRDSTVTLEAPAAEGRHFARWDDMVTANPRTITPTQDVSLTALYAPNRYHLAVTAEEDEEGFTTGGGSYQHGDTAVIEATANEGYHFEEWNDGVVDNPREVVVVSDTVIVAHFAPNSHELVVRSSDSAQGRTTGSGSYAYGSTAVIGATAHEGYRFKEWNDGDTTNPREVVVLSDTSFTACFEAGEPSSIDDADGMEIELSPNPSSGKVSISANEDIETIGLYDMSGKKVCQMGRTGSRRIDMDLKGLASGVYIVKITTANGTETKKLIVE